MNRIILALALLLAFATGALADKAVSRTYFTTVLADVNELRFTRNANAANGWTASAVGNVRASDGANYAALIVGNITSGQRTTIETYITNNVLPALNTQEGL